MAMINIARDPAQLAHYVADYIETVLSTAISERGQCSFVLSGGATPCDTYRLLATPEFANRIDWSSIHIFWGDERGVPPNDPESNYRMAYEALLKHVPIPKNHIHRMHGEDAPETAAAAYEAELRSYFSGRSPGFDLILLGLGEDGHTASLFSGSAALYETKRWVLSQCVQAVPQWRLTLTPPAINASRNIAFIVSGAGKSTILDRVLNGPFLPDILSAQLISPENGKLIWFVDQAALL